MKIEKSTINSFFLALGYIGVAYIIQFLLYYVGGYFAYPNAETLHNWDVGWYDSIAKDGYMNWEGEPSNTGFFILFPFLWKLLHLNIWGVVVMNAVFFSVGFALFNSIFQLEKKVQLLWLTIPSMYFVWIPYTEALFVLLIAASLVGIVKNNRWLIWVSLFLLALTRPTTTILLPAFLITELLVNGYKQWLQSIKVYIINYALPLCLGLVAFIYYQYHVTGVWFAYFIQQKEGWGHKFAIPTFPLSTTGSNKLFWLNGIAFFLGLVSLVVLVRLFLKWLKGSAFQHDRLFILSSLYFVGICLVTLFFNPIWGSFTTNVHDIHRYAFVSPFLWVLLYRYTVAPVQYKTKHVLLVFFVSNLLWLAFGDYQHIQSFLYFNVATLYIIVYMLQGNKKANWLIPVLAGFSFLYQTFMFQWFMLGLYPG